MALAPVLAGIALAAQAGSGIMSTIKSYKEGKKNEDLRNMQQQAIKDNYGALKNFGNEQNQGQIGLSSVGAPSVGVSSVGVPGIGGQQSNTLGLGGYGGKLKLGQLSGM